MKKVNKHQLEELRRGIEHNDLFEYATKLIHRSESMEDILERRRIARKIIGRVQSLLAQFGMFND